MKKVLMCGSALTEPGGMTSVCKQLINHDWGGEFEIRYVPTHVSGTPLTKISAFFSGVREIKQVLKDGNCSAVHIHMSYKGSFLRKYYVFLLCERYEVPCLLHMHGSEFKQYYHSASTSLKAKIVRMLEGSHTVIALGDGWRVFFNEIAPSANVVVLKNAVPFPGLKPRRRHSVFGIVFMGLLIKRKGVADLIDGFSSFLQRSTGDAHLYIAGTGKDEEFLREQVSSCGLDDSVSFLGWIDSRERDRLLSDVDVFVLPSYNEGLPIALLEAMAVGLPSVVSNVGSVSEAVLDGVDGMLVSPGCPDQIADALFELNGDESLWRGLSHAAMLKIETEFNETTYFERVAAIYRSATSTAKA